MANFLDWHLFFPYPGGKAEMANFLDWHLFLTLNKSTVADLNGNEMIKIKGGALCDLTVIKSGCKNRPTGCPC